MECVLLVQVMGRVNCGREMKLLEKEEKGDWAEPDGHVVGTEGNRV